MTNDQLMAVAAIFVPLLVSVLKRENLSNAVNGAIAVGVYVVVGLIAVVVSGQTFTLDNIVPAISIFTVGGTAAYTMFWSNWGDPQITAKVNGGPTTP